MSLSKVRKKAKIRNRYNQVPHLAKDIVWENDKNRAKRHIQESQEFTSFLAGDQGGARHRQYGKDKYKQERFTKEVSLEWPVRKLLEGFIRCLVLVQPR